MDNYEELVSLAKKDNPDAFTELFGMVNKDLYRFAFYTLKNAHDAEDVVSDTILDAYESIKRLRKESSFRSWIFMILSNKCKRKLKQYVNKSMPLDDNLAAVTRDLGEEYDVRNAFSQLTAEERLIVSMQVFGGYNSKEIGKILNINANTIRSKHHRALIKMEQLLNDSDQKGVI